MMKETPHDFFLTHPDNPYIRKMNRPTIVEFDSGNEYSGQGVVANTWPEYTMKDGVAILTVLMLPDMLQGRIVMGIPA